MKVRELIEFLQGVDDPDAEVAGKFTVYFKDESKIAVTLKRVATRPKRGG